MEQSQPATAQSCDQDDQQRGEIELIRSMLEAADELEQDMDEQSYQLDKMIKLAIHQANKNAMQAEHAISIRDGLSGMVIGRVANFIDLEVIKQLHIDKGTVQKVHMIDQNTATLVDSVEAFNATLAQEPESAILMFAFDDA